MSNITKLHNSYQTSTKSLQSIKICDGVLKFISCSPRLLDFEKYLHRQQPYNFCYCLHEIPSISNIKELNESYLTSTKSLKLIINWWLCIESHVSPPKVVELWKILSPPAIVWYSILLIWNTFISNITQLNKCYPTSTKIDSCKLRFISRLLKWLDCEKYFHCQQPYGI